MSRSNKRLPLWSPVLPFHFPEPWLKFGDLFGQEFQVSFKMRGSFIKTYHYPYSDEETKRIAKKKAERLLKKKAKEFGISVDL